mgnify:CR=1 FL=1
MLFRSFVLNLNVLASEESPKDVNVVIYTDATKETIERIIKIKTDTCIRYEKNAYIRVTTSQTGYEVKGYEKDESCNEQNRNDLVAEVKENVDEELKSCGESLEAYTYDSTCTEKEYDFPYYACECAQEDNEYANYILQRKGNTWFFNLYSDAKCKKVSRRMPEYEIEGGVCVEHEGEYIKLPAFNGSVTVTILLVLLIAVLI